MIKALFKMILVASALGAAIGLSALMLPSAHADIRILASPGGEVGPFLQLFERVRASGERVVIDGPCLSACTLVLDMVPSDRICVTRRAILGFHGARSIDRRGRGGVPAPPARGRAANARPRSRPCRDRRLRCSRAAGPRTGTTRARCPACSSRRTCRRSRSSWRRSSRPGRRRSCRGR